MLEFGRQRGHEGILYINRSNLGANKVKKKNLHSNQLNQFSVADDWTVEFGNCIQNSGGTPRQKETQRKTNKEEREEYKKEKKKRGKRKK